MRDNNLIPMIREFGLPDVIDVNRNGMALWKQSTLVQRGFCWQQVTLRDQIDYCVVITYLFPIQLLQWIQLLDDLHDFNAAVTYNRLDQTIRVQGQTPQEVVVLSTLAKRILASQLTLQQAQHLIPQMLSAIDPQAINYDPDAMINIKSNYVHWGFL